MGLDFLESDRDLDYSDIPSFIKGLGEMDQLYLLQTMFGLDGIKKFGESDSEYIEGLYVISKGDKVGYFLVDYGLLDFDLESGEYFYGGSIGANYYREDNCIAFLFFDYSVIRFFDINNKYFIEDSEVVSEILGEGASSIEDEDIIVIAGEYPLKKEETFH